MDRKAASPIDRPSSGEKRGYHVVYETVTKERKKLKSEIWPQQRPPNGYTFVGTGTPDIMEWCKEQSRKRDLLVYIVVSNVSNDDRWRKISPHTNRVGYHFQSNLVAEALQVHGGRSRQYQYYHQSDDDQNRVRRAGNERAFRRAPPGRAGRVASGDTDAQQIAEAVKEMFPHIPTGEVGKLVKRAFEHGTGRIGNATDQTLARKVQLAVVAHIRHEYTSYDSLLKAGVDRDEARSRVEEAILETVLKWRGEGEADDDVEEAWKEVIVINEDDDDGDASSPATDDEEPEQEPEPQVTELIDLTQDSSSSDTEGGEEVLGRVNKRQKGSSRWKTRRDRTR